MSDKQTFWKTHRYDLYDTTGGLVASTYRTPNDNWCWFLTAENVSGENTSVTEAMQSVEDALKVTPGTAIGKVTPIKDEAEARKRLDRVVNEVTRLSAEAGAIGINYTVVVPTSDGRDFALSFSRLPPVRWAESEGSEEGKKVLLALDAYISKLFRESMEKAVDDAMTISIKQAEEAAAAAEKSEEAPAEAPVEADSAPVAEA